MHNSDEPAPVLAADLLEADPTGLRLVAGRQRADGRVVFPFPQPADGQADCERILLNPCGTLWSWTVQRFPPKSPPYCGPDGDAFRPFFVGYVEFPEGVVVEGRIEAEVDVDQLRIGMPMVTTAWPLGRSAGGDVTCIHAFRPALTPPDRRRER